MMQLKTGNYLVLPLLPEVRDALDNYMQNARPISKSPYIFLSSSAPFMPLSRTAIWSIVSKYFKEAGICIEGKRHGPHSLRSSLASALVNENVPYSVVQEILGHEDPNSTKHYAKIDVERLRVYALEVPPPSGAFGECLGSERGGTNEI